MSIARQLNDYFFEPVMNFFIPALCIVCGRPLPFKRKAICADCYEQLPHLTKEQFAVLKEEVFPAAFDEMVVVFQFAPLFQQLIHLLKYQRFLTIADYFADSLTPLLVKEEYDLISAVPLHPVRYRERGYNQSALIARRLAENLSVTFSENLVRRVRNTPSQTKLSREERKINMDGAFNVKEDVSGARIVLIDDVLTTGSTLNACATELKNRGALKVCAAAIATPVDFLQHNLEVNTVQQLDRGQELF